MGREGVDGHHRPPSRRADPVRQCIERGECRPRHRSAKNTRQWCKGKVGVAHDWRWVPFSALPNATHWPQRDARHGVGWRVREVQLCQRCGKEGEFRTRCRYCGTVATRSRWWRFSSDPSESCGAVSDEALEREAREREMKLWERGR